MDVSILKITLAVEPVPEYNTVTWEKTVPCIALVPIVLTI